MVSASREREGAPSPWDAPRGALSAGPGVPLLAGCRFFTADADPLCPLWDRRGSAGCLSFSWVRGSAPRVPGQHGEGSSRTHVLPSPRVGNLEDGKKKGSACLLCGKRIRGVRPSAF